MRISLIFVEVSLLFLLAGVAVDTSANAISEAKPPLTLEQREKWRILVGKWYGSQPTKDGGERKWIVERSPLGKFKAVFRTYEKDMTSYWEQIEVGDWGVSGPVYFTIFRGWIGKGKLKLANPADPYNYDAYKIIALTGQEFEYESYDSFHTAWVNSRRKQASRFTSALSPLTDIGSRHVRFQGRAGRN
jgi:hypothetical protein